MYPVPGNPPRLPDSTPPASRPRAIPLERAPGRESIFRDTRGAFAIIFALMLPLLVSAIGLGVEIGGWYAAGRSL